MFAPGWSGVDIHGNRRHFRRVLKRFVPGRLIGSFLIGHLTSTSLIFHRSSASPHLSSTSDHRWSIRFSDSMSRFD